MTHPYQTPPAYRLDHLRIEQPGLGHPSRLGPWSFRLTVFWLYPLAIVGEQSRHVLSEPVGEKQRRAVGGHDLRAVVHHALGHCQGAIPDVERQQQFALGVHRCPDPLGRPLQALDGLSLADDTVLDRAEQGEEFIELHLPDPHVVQDVSGESLQLLRCFDQPLQHRIGVHLEHPRRAPDTQAFGQAREDPHDELDGGVLAMKDRAEGLEKVAATDDAQQLAPTPPIGMAVGADIPPSRPTSVPAIWVRTEMGGGVDLAAASPCGHDPRRRSEGGLWARVGGVLTGITMGLVGMARKGCGLTLALWQGGWGLWCYRARSGITGPHPMEYEVQPHQGDQHQLVEKER